MPAPEKILLVVDGEYVECAVETAPNGDYVCTAESGRFLKFPASGGSLKAQAGEYNAQYGD